MTVELARVAIEQPLKAATESGASAKDIGSKWNGELPASEMQSHPLWEGELPANENKPGNQDGTLPSLSEIRNTSSNDAIQTKDVASAENKELLKNECHTYNEEVKQYSAGGDTQPVEPQDLTRRTPQDLQQARTEFNQKREELIADWERKNDMDWPRYTEDVYSTNGKLIRRSGDRYDAHHVQPLELGGDNSAANITPMHAKDHYDKQGVHRPNGPYDTIATNMRG